MTIPIAHDFGCPWCWVGLLQAKRLVAEFGVEIDWQGYELWPEELDWPEPLPPAAEPPANKPKTPSRLDFLLAGDGIVLPAIDRPKRMRTHLAHEAVEWARARGQGSELLEALYRAFWLQGREINSPEVLQETAERTLGTTEGLAEALETRAFADRIVGFDDPAHQRGVYHVPTFFIGGERFAEQPYSVLRAAVIRHAGVPDAAGSIYADLVWPATPADRPAVAIDMVATIDGKILSGDPSNGLVELGSRVDHELMRRIEASADAVLVGAKTLRDTSTRWNPSAPVRVVLTNHGELPQGAAFLTGRAFVASTSPHASFDSPPGVGRIAVGSLPELLAHLRRHLGVERLLVLGGSEVNASFLAEDLADELFLTLAPKVKLGREIPTYAGGDPLPPDALRAFELKEHHAVGSEVFLRYRRTGVAN